MLRIVAISLILTGTAMAAHADVYRWVDANGHVQYSDRWVPGSVLIKVDRPRTAASSSTERSSSSSSSSSSDRASEIVRDQQTARAVQQDVASARAQQCAEAKKRYEGAIQARRLYRTGANGERIYMTDAEIDAYRLQARNEMETLCGK